MAVSTANVSTLSMLIPMTGRARENSLEGMEGWEWAVTTGSGSLYSLQSGLSPGQAPAQDTNNRYYSTVAPAAASIEQTPPTSSRRLWSRPSRPSRARQLCVARLGMQGKELEGFMYI